MRDCNDCDDGQEREPACNGAKRLSVDVIDSAVLHEEP